MYKIVVLGTGTDIGKTYLAEQLARLLRDASSDAVVAVKPVETGVTSAGCTDAKRLSAASRPVYQPAHAYAFEVPISPHLAARRAGVEIETEEIAHWVGTMSRKSKSAPFAGAPGWIIVETAGGVFSPISDTKTNLDLATALEPSCWMLVANDCLGVLHSVRSTLLAMNSLARSPDVVLLNAPRVPDTSTGTNREELERLGWARVTASIDRNGGFQRKDAAALLAKLRQHFE